MRIANRQADHNGADFFRQTPAGRFFGRCAGLTLIELLIVIVILTSLVAAAIPVLSPSTDQRRLREASRGVNTFITSAQAKAISLRRPYGVALKKLATETGSAADSGVCLELYHVEQPPAFTGFDESAAVQLARDEDGAAPPDQVIVRFVRRGNGIPSATDALLEGWDRDEIPPGIFRRGDVIEIAGNQFVLVDSTADVDPAGYYVKSSGTPDGELVARPVGDSGQVLRFTISNRGRELGEGDAKISLASLLAAGSPEANGPFWTEPAPYKILRQPTPTSSLPYQLPEGIAIDLRASGSAIDFNTPIPGGFFHRPELVGPPEDAVFNRSPVVIMFSPEGSIERIHLNNANQESLTEPDEVFSGPVVSNIYLLVGRRENIPAPDPLSDPTLEPAIMGQAVQTLPDAERQKLSSPVNWLDLESRWVVIGSQSGRVVTTESAFVDLQSWSNSSSHAYLNVPPSTPAPLWRRALQIHAAREFARQMTQMGGR